MPCHFPFMGTTISHGKQSKWTSDLQGIAADAARTSHLRQESGWAMVAYPSLFTWADQDLVSLHTHPENRSLSMNVARYALIVPLIAVVALSGCRERGDSSSPVAQEEASSENARLTGEVTMLTADNNRLKAMLQIAGDELDKAKANPPIGSAGGGLGDIQIPGLVKTETGSLALNDDFAFAKGSAELNPDGKKSISKLAETLNQSDHENAMVLVTGHTDDTPVSRQSTIDRYHDNWGLSAARSAAVIRALEEAHVSAKRIIGQFRGSQQPRNAGHDKADMAANRRVEISLGQ
jgi:flagellar motor protein MotB